MNNIATATIVDTWGRFLAAGDRAPIAQLSRRLNQDDRLLFVAPQATEAARLANAKAAAVALNESA